MNRAEAQAVARALRHWTDSPHHEVALALESAIGKKRSKEVLADAVKSGRLHEATMHMLLNSMA